jgi:DNA-directed RNA polymerase subunit RPC12/RpoP
MSPPPRRSVLTLKSSPAKAPALQWKCKPCGAAFEVAGELADDAAVRCPSCNARLGRAEQFRSDPPDPKVRARQVERKAEPPPAPGGRAKVVVVERKPLTARR